MIFKFDGMNEVEQWIICSVVGEEVQEITASPGYDGTLEIEFTINGVEVNFSKIAEAIQRNMEYSIKKQVKEFVPKVTLTRIGNLNDALYELEKRINNLNILDILTKEE